MKTNDVAAAVYLEMLLLKEQLKKVLRLLFDRGGFIYQGKIKALADAAREAGLEF